MPATTTRSTAARGDDTLTGGTENDILNGDGGNDSLNGGQGIDTLNGGNGNDTLIGGADADTLTGGDGDDVLDGGGANDTLNGGIGIDRLTGGAGRDVMTGGADADTFIFTANNQSTTAAATRDIVTDFLVGSDRVDLSAIDADTSAGANEAFSFVGTGAFTARGQIRYVYETVGGVEYTVIQTNNAGNTGADFTLALQGHHVLTAASFVL